MQSLFGFVGGDYVVVVADASQQQSILVIKDDLDRIYEADDRFAFACVGEPGDDTAYADYITRNIQLNKFRNGYSSTAHANANWMRRVLADGIREDPYQCNCIIGGVDIPSKMLSLKAETTSLTDNTKSHVPEAEGSSSSSSNSNEAEEVKATPHLYFLDYLGTLCELPFAAQGYCGYLLYGLWDSMWKKNMSYDDGIRMLLASIKQMHKRFPISQKTYIAKIITKDGIRRIDIEKEEERINKLDANKTTTTTSSSSSNNNNNGSA